MSPPHRPEEPADATGGDGIPRPGARFRTHLAGTGRASSPEVGAETRTLLDRWRGLRPWARVALTVGAALLALNAGLSALDTLTGGSGPTGPTSSSYATAPSGLAALAELLGDHGHAVRRIRDSLDKAGLEPGATLVLADAGAGTPAELGAIRRFVAAGGRLIVAGGGATELLGALTGAGPKRATGPASPARPLAALPETSGVHQVVGDAHAAGFAADTGAALPALGSRRAVLAAVAAVGRGRVVALADSSPWHNRRLAAADNAAFALAAAGEEGRPVLFSEAPHGYGASAGLGAFPSDWKWAAALSLVAVLVAMWAKGRRLGAPEVLERELPPPRKAYVDAIAATLARARQPAEAQAAIQTAARRRLARRAGLGPSTTSDELRQAARQVGLADEEADALVAPGGGEQGVMGAARALARLEGGER